MQYIQRKMANSNGLFVMSIMHVPIYLTSMRIYR